MAFDLSLADILSATQPAAQLLMARGRKVGLPLGAGLSIFGGLADAMQQHQQSRAQNTALIQALQQSNPAAAKALAPFAQAGGNVQEAFKTLFPQQKSAGLTPFEVWQKQNPSAPVADWEKIIQKPEKLSKETPFDLWLKQNPTGTFTDYEHARLTGERPEKPDKPREQVITNDDGTRVILNLDTGATRPVAGKSKTTGAPKPWGRKDAMAAYDRADKAARTKLTKPGTLWGKTAPSEDDVARERTVNLARYGLDADGNPLPVGAKMTLP